MRTGMFALALGLLALRLLPVLPPVGWLLVLPVVALMLLPFRTYPLAFFLLGLAWACFSAQRALDDRLMPALDGQTRWLEGRVSGALRALRTERQPVTPGPAAPAHPCELAGRPFRAQW